MNQETITRILLVSGAAAGTGYGSWYLYEFNQPKNYKDLVSWLGHKIAQDENAWKASFIDNKTSLKELIKDIEDSSNADKDYLKLKSWCQERFQKAGTKGDLEKKEIKDEIDRLSKYCTDNPKTVEAKLQRLGKSGWITAQEDYKVLVVLYKDQTDLQEILKQNSSEGSETAESDEAEKNSEKLKDFCEKGLKKPLDGSFNTVSRQIFKWCKPYTQEGKRTVEEILKKEKDGWTKESTSDNFQKIFKKWQYTTGFMEVLNKDKGNDSVTSDDNDGGEKLQQWCEDTLKENIWEGVVYPEKYKWVKSVCKSS